MPAVNYCSCDDFYFRVMNSKVHLCYHIIAQKLAEALKCYEDINCEDEYYDELVSELKEENMK